NGSLYVFLSTGSQVDPFGQNPSPDYFESGPDHALFGYSIAKLRRVNRDSRPDFAVGAPVIPPDQMGYVRVYGYVIGQIVELTTPGRPDDDPPYFGSSITGGDVNGDGFSDLIVSATPYVLGSGGSGAVYAAYATPDPCDPMAVDWSDLNQIESYASGG